MRRLVMLGAWLLVAVATKPAAGQRAASPPRVRLEEPRPAPVFPVAVVPFTIPAELCQGGQVPAVTLRVHTALSQPVRTLRLRTRDRDLLDQLPLRCGVHVAIWDGTIDNGTRIAPPYVYWLELRVTLPGQSPLRDTKPVLVGSN